MFIKGVNLGNWLVLEKWMSPALFQGTDAEDEYYLPRRLSKEVYEARIRIHRSEYITERDFAQIRALGMNMVRIPVPYFVFGDCPPFLGCTEELDKAFAWAEKYGLQILLDLHTVPGSQNGFDNGGRARSRRDCAASRPAPPRAATTRSPVYTSPRCRAPSARRKAGAAPYRRSA